MIATIIKPGFGKRGHQDTVNGIIDRHWVVPGLSDAAVVLPAPNGSVVRGICALACFPYEAMQHLQDWRSKIDVLCRGLAVVIGPTVGGIALFTYAGAVFGNAAIILFLPLLAFLIDWRITGSASGITRSGENCRSFILESIIYIL